MKRKGFLYYNFLGLRLLFGIMPVSMVCYCGLELLHGISWVLQVVSMQYFFDAVTNGTDSAFKIGAKLLLMGGAFLFAQMMNGVANCYGQILNKSAGKEMNKMIFQRIARLEVIAFEDTEELNRMNKAVKGSERLFWVSTTILDIIFFYVSYFAMMGWYLFSRAPVLSISIIIIFIPNIAGKLFSGITFRRLEEILAPLRRKCEYYESCMTDREYYKETRLLGINRYFKERYADLLQRINRLNFKAQLHKEMINFIVSVLTVSAYGSIICLLVYLVMRNVISVGVFAAVFASLRQFYGFMDEVISERFGWASENVATVENFLSFIEGCDEKREGLRLPEQYDIRLRNVGFSYPQIKEKDRSMALEGIDLEVPWGQTVALVGENGSGKSTLCGIVAGLYKPTSGTVSYEGTEIGEGGTVGGISAVFQNYCRYRMTLSENICISEIERETTERELAMLCEETGIDRERIGGLDSVLGKDFGGAELSGGQWQRIAIARGLFRSKGLLILDEPTASIDPLEENRLYLSFRKMCAGCTAFIVTHRLASAQFADRILVMKEGRIVQDGGHEQLMELGGEYREMYEIQQQWYKEKR